MNKNNLIVLMTVNTAAVILCSQFARADLIPESDELRITDIGVQIYDQLIFETPAAPETSLTWSPGAALPPINAAQVPGAQIVLLTEPANEVPDPGETLISIQGPNGNVYFVSDAVISTIGSTQAPFQVSLVSDGDPDLQGIVNFLQASGAPWTPVPETGGLQDLTSFLVPTQFPWTVQVRSDVNVPEPSTFVMLGLGIASLFAYRRRKRVA
jgi:hypothetical protein